MLERREVCDLGDSICLTRKRFVMQDILNA